MFLADLDPRSLADAAPAGIVPADLFLGAGDSPLQVAVFKGHRKPGRPELRELWTKRHRGGVAPVAIVVLWGNARASLCTHTGVEQAELEDLEASQAERICRAALTAPDRHSALRLLAATLGQLESAVPGLRNAGLFAMHELEHGVPARPDWAKAAAAARPMLALRGRPLVERLGFKVDQLPGPASLLLAGGNRRVAVAVFLERPDQIEPAATLFDHLSPVSFALAKADEHNLDYVVVSAGTTLRIYPVKPGVGTGRRGRTETFVELDLALLRDEQAGYLHLLASAEALHPEGSFVSILNASREFAVGLGERLRDRVYEEVVPGFAAALVKARHLRNPSTDKLAETYEMALLVLFRLLFVAYAEDKELLPLHSSESYRQHSLKQLALRLQREREQNAEYGQGAHYWSEVTQLWRAIDRGNPAWHVPAYNGGLFSEEATSAAKALAALELPDTEFALPLRALLLDESGEGAVGPIDFRSLGVREFGTIYEGLLEQDLAVAEHDLTVEKKTGAYVPARKGGAVVVPEGRVYLHNASGARKASGAYYTKDFAVEHLLEHALDPALDDHLARVSAHYDDREKSERFFDFHVADIAMGSGHFLVAAIDHIERKLSGFLAKFPLAGVRNELERLRTSAREALGDDYRGDVIEDTQLLRRQIARRCVFGVDLNPLSVELARLSIWIHTFVPGLPLSFLDQNLVVGNSLVGIATLDEARELMGATDDLFGLSADALLGKTREPLARLGRLADADAAELKEARRLHRQARELIRPTEELFAILAASRVDRESRTDEEKKEKKQNRSIAAAVADRQVAVEMAPKDRERLLKRAATALAGLKALHFPVAFPQVFLGDRPGFDVILGNPPWEKARLEELEFWGRHQPGIRALGTGERERQLKKLHTQRPDLVALLDLERLASDSLRDLVRWMPGMNTGHPDLFRAFLWRFLQLATSSHGRLGVVLPGETFKVRGARPIRELLSQHSAKIDVQLATNRGEWLFAEVDTRKLVALVAVEVGVATDGAHFVLRPEVHSLEAFAAQSRVAHGPVPSAWLKAYSPALILPILPSSSSLAVLDRFVVHPRLSKHRDFEIVRVYADFETTRDRDKWHLAKQYGDWPVYKGESFDLWVPDTGTYFGFTEGNSIRRALFERVQRATSASPYGTIAAAVRSDADRLAALRPRIAFRDVTNRTNRRTLVASLIPPNVVTTQTAPWVLWKQQEPEPFREAVLLGFLSSIPTDWWMRRFAEGHVDQEAFDSIPIPLIDWESSAAVRVRDIAARLATPDDRFEEWVSHFKLEPKVLDAEEKNDLIAELDAAVSLLYGLAKKDVVHIFETFHEGWDYEERLRLVLDHRRRLTRLE